ncbi:MAG: hypothetical protein MJZ34_05440 [Paludibacteraceae bacterium]|nr:hypothetical protein [Paludibacteraceae bacterium]
MTFEQFMTTYEWLFCIGIIVFGIMLLIIIRKIENHFNIPKDWGCGRKTHDKIKKYIETTPAGAFLYECIALFLWLGCDSILGMLFSIIGGLNLLYNCLDYIKNENED